MNVITHECQTYPFLLKSKEEGNISDEIWEKLKKSPRFLDWLNRVGK